MNERSIRVKVAPLFFLPLFQLGKHVHIRIWLHSVNKALIVHRYIHTLNYPGRTSERIIIEYIGKHERKLWHIHERHIICLQLSNAHIWSCIERIKAYFSIQTIIDLHHEYACHFAAGGDRAQHSSVACCLDAYAYILLIQQCRRHTSANKCRCRWFVLLKFTLSEIDYSINHVIDQRTRKLLGGGYRNRSCFSFDLILKEEASTKNDVLIESNIIYRELFSSSG